MPLITITPLGKFVKARRLALCMTQYRLGERAGGQYPLIQRLESGRGKWITPRQVKILAIGLDVDVSDVLQYMTLEARLEYDKGAHYLLISANGS